MDARMHHRVTETETDALYQRFPHLRRIDLLWGSAECRKYVFDLMTDTRGGTRMGFPKEHALTIMKLLMEHDQRFPQFEHQITNLWGEDERRRGSRK
jgi:hypothetical protein